jgi:hypothetical protein
MLDREIEKMIPSGWSWALYSARTGWPARAVITSPDYRVHIGREGESVEAALRKAARDARAGERE